MRRRALSMWWNEWKTESPSTSTRAGVAAPTLGDVPAITQLTTTNIAASRFTGLRLFA
jgi:hypothetical protein